MTFRQIASRQTGLEFKRDLRCRYLPELKVIYIEMLTEPTGDHQGKMRKGKKAQERTMGRTYMMITQGLLRSGPEGRRKARKNVMETN